MAKQAKKSVILRIEGLPIIIVFVLLLGLFMYTAPEVFLQPFIYTTFLSTLPPLILLAIGLTFVIGAGEIDLCFPAIIGFSGFVFAVLFKEYNLGWIAVVVALGVRSPDRLHQRRPRRQGGHPLLHGDAGRPVLLVRHGNRAVRRQVLCAARRRGELGLAGDRRPPLCRHQRARLGPAAAAAIAVDGDHRRLPVVHPEPPPLRRAHAVHRQFERRLARRRHQCRPARRSSSSP